MSRFKLMPRTFVVSMLIAILTCSLLGRLAARSTHLASVKRFNQYLNPMSYFAPTPSQIAAATTSNLSKDQTLVLIGGNSNFNGVGQNLNELWSDELQRLAGPQYKIVNLATMGSNGFDLAGVVYRIVNPTHPKTLLVLNVYTNSMATIDGTDWNETVPPFNYFFWDALSKGLFKLDEHLRPTAKELQRLRLKGRNGTERYLQQLFDDASYARDFWTYIGYKWFFSIISYFTKNTPFTARENVLEQMETYPPLNDRIRRSGMSMELLLANTRAHFEQVPKGEKAEADYWSKFRDQYAAVFSQEYRPSILICILTPNPYFLSRLSKTEQQLFEKVVARARSEIEGLGYRVLVIGPQLEAEDFETSFHYVATGGEKMARLIDSELKKHKFESKVR